LGRWTKRDSIGEAGGVNLYDFTTNDSVNLFDKLGFASLGFKLWQLYLLRVIGHQVIFHRFRREYEFFDDESELILKGNSDLRDLIHDAIKKSAIRQGVTTSWQRQFLNRVYIGKAKIGEYGIQSAGYLLHEAHANYAQGAYSVKCENGKLIFNHLQIDYEWHDEIDGNSIKETLDRYYKTDNNTYFDAYIDALIDFGPLVEATIADVLPDKILSADYFVIISGHYIVNKEFTINLEHF